jgi:hypothetical protein
MILTRAIKLAIECVDSQLRNLAWYADRHDFMGLRTSEAINASNRRRDLREAKQAIEQIFREPENEK